MRISTIGYSMKQGVKNIRRNKMFSVASIATMAACIFLFGLFYSIVVNFSYIVEKAEEGVAITVFFNEDTTKEQKDTIGAQLKKERSDYMETHNWRMVPTGNKSLYCDECEKSFSEDSLFTIGIKNDTIYYFTRTDGRLGYTYITGHKSELSQSLKEYSPFRYHYEIFKDSLTDESEDYDLITSELSYHYLDEYVKRLKKRAPYGFFTDWGWDSEYSCISFHFNYMNTNRNTIKYIDVYFKVTNDVGDLRKTGHFQGTGPLREFESASWEWDTSYYYVSGDASNMNITKVILTYMNGTKKVLTGNLLVFE